MKERKTAKKKGVMGIEHVIGHAGEFEADEMSDEIAAPKNDLRQSDPDGGHAGEQPIFQPEGGEGEEEGEIAEIQKISRSVFSPIDRHQYRHERGEGQFDR